MEKITKVRLSEFDVLQGLAMILVVLGHHLLPFMPQWYNVMHNYLYTFHMPLFIFISGFLIQYTHKPINNFSLYISYAGKKARKFIPPYFVIGLCCIFLVGEYHSLIAFANELFCLLFSPKQSVTTFLWYIYLLFFYYLLFPIYVDRNKYIKLVIFFLSIYGFTNPSHSPYFCFDYFCEYSIFFLLGTFFAKNYTDFRKKLFRISKTTIVLFVVLSVSRFFSDYNYIVDLMLPLLAIPTFYGLSVILNRFEYIAKSLKYISINCFSIYLFHMFFVQVGAVLVSVSLVSNSVFFYIAYLLLSIFISILLSSKIYSLVKKIERKVILLFN